MRGKGRERGAKITQSEGEGSSYKSIGISQNSPNRFPKGTSKFNWLEVKLI